MDKLAALQTFLNGFLPAYEENSIYSLKNPPAFPYLTYEGVDDNFGDNTDVAMTVNTWYRESSWYNAVLKSKEIAETIGRSGKMLTCDEGYVLVMRASPFSTRMGDDSDDLIKRTMFNLTVRFYTNY
jgi:hypothetical protein